MNEGDILKTIKSIRKEKRTKFSDGCPDKGDDSYIGCIESLRIILSTGEAKNDYVVDEIYSAISEFETHMDLGIIKDGEFCELSPSIAARYNKVAGTFTFAGFLILKREDALPILSDPNGSHWPSGCAWDAESESLISLSRWYRRHPDVVLGLPPEVIEKYKLEEIFQETLLSIGD